MNGKEEKETKEDHQFKRKLKRRKIAAKKQPGK